MTRSHARPWSTSHSMMSSPPRSRWSLLTYENAGSPFAPALDSLLLKRDKLQAVALAHNGIQQHDSTWIINDNKHAWLTMSISRSPLAMYSQPRCCADVSSAWVMHTQQLIAQPTFAHCFLGTLQRSDAIAIQSKHYDAREHERQNNGR
jgi:hypothetical protein